MGFTFQPLTPLHWLVLLTGAWAVVALLWLYWRSRQWGKRQLFSQAAGDPMAGVRYAFIKGMHPAAKESVMMALPSYFAGVTYHMGAMVAFLLLALHFLGWEGMPLVRGMLSVLAGVGAICGLALLIKRAVTPNMRALSRPDDFISNGLVTAFAWLACLTGFIPSLWTAWFVSAAVLLFYMPLGKIRHCVFFFSTRYHLGVFFGRRGVFPPA